MTRKILKNFSIGVKRVATPIAAFLIAGLPVSADQQLIPPGATQTAGQIGHTFMHGCPPTLPTFMEDRAEVYQTAFGWEAIDLGGDAGYISPEGAITVLIDGNPLAATCEMSIVADLVGDGADLYDSLAAHLTEAVDDHPSATAIEGGLQWMWASVNATFTLQFIEVEGAFLLSLTSES